MSNHAKAFWAPVDPELQFSLACASSGASGSDWHSSTVFSDSESGIYTKVRSGSTDQTKRLVTENLSGATA